MFKHILDEKYYNTYCKITNMYLITSRQGLYIFNLNQKSFSKLRDGYFFGCCYHTTSHKWYVFGYNGDTVKDKNIPTFQGYIASFKLELNDDVNHTYEILDWKIECDNLDNGTHQMKIYNNKLYVLETYIQNVKIYNIDCNGNLKSLENISLGDKVCNAHYIVNHHSM